MTSLLHLLVVTFFLFAVRAHSDERFEAPRMQFSFQSPIENFLTDIEITEPSSGILPIDCVYVINLQKRKEKWFRTDKRFREHNIFPNRVNAVNGWLLSEEQKQSLMGHYPMRLRGGEVGCLLSHISVLKDAYIREFSHIWVCEDDIIIKEDPHQLTALITQLTLEKPDWDILYTDFDTKNMAGQRVPSLDADFRPDQYYPPLSYYRERILLNEDISEIRQRFGAYSFILSRGGIQKLYNYFTQLYLWSPYDIDMHYAPGIKQFCINRDLVTVDLSTPSDTYENRTF